MRKTLLKTLLVGLLTLVGVNPIRAAHTHCICGTGTCTGGSHSHESHEWTEWTSTNSLPASAGYYYLANDVTLSDTWYPADGTFLCLNGHDIKRSGTGRIFEVNAGRTFTLTDCGTNVRYVKDTNGDDRYEVVAEAEGAVAITGGIVTGVIPGSAGDDYGGGLRTYGTFNMYGGNFVGCGAGQGGGALYAEGNTCVINMYGGTVTGNSGFRGVIAARRNLHIYGGIIQNNSCTRSVIALWTNNGNISNCIIRNNKKESTDDSNGIIWCGSDMTTGNITISNVQFEGNRSNIGMILADASVTIENCTISSVDPNSTALGFIHAKKSFTLGGGMVFPTSNTIADLYLKSGAVANLSTTNPLGSSEVFSVLTEKDPSSTTPQIDITGTNSSNMLSHFTAFKEANAQYLTNKENVVCFSLHYHCICGTGKCTGGSHSHEAHIWTKWTSTNSLPADAGYYYLANDVTLNSTWYPADGTFLCLNGHDIKRSNDRVFIVNAGRTFTLTDCGTNVRYVKDTNGDGRYEVVSSAEGAVAITGGIVTGALSGSGGETYGGAGYIYGTFNLYGGNFVGCAAAQGGSAFIGDKKDATVNMYGGTITGNTGCRGAVVCGHKSTMYIYGGLFQNNTTALGTLVYFGSGIAKDFVLKNNICGDPNWGGTIWTHGDPNFTTSEEVTLTNIQLIGNTGSAAFVMGELTNTIIENCTITDMTLNQTAKGYITANTSFTLGGGVSIENAGSKPDIYLADGKIANLSTTHPLGNTEVFSVLTEKDPSSTTPKIDITGTNSSNMLSHFTAFKEANIPYLINKDNVVCFSWIDPAKIVTDGAGKTYSAAQTEVNNKLSEWQTASTSNTIDVTIVRTILKNGYFNTLCLPFDLTADQIAETFGTYKELKEYVSCTVIGSGDDRELVLNVTDATTITAGKAYLISFENGTDLTKLDFKGVKVTKTAASEATKSGHASFQGILAPYQLPYGNEDYLFLGQQNRLFWPINDGTFMKGFRAYFKVDTSAPSAPVKRGMKASFGTGKTVPTSNNNVNVNDNNEIKKLIEDGRVVIMSNGVKYDMNGCKIVD